MLTIVVFPTHAASFTGTKTREEHQGNCDHSFLLSGLLQSVHDCEHFVRCSGMCLLGSGCFPGNHGIPNGIHTIEQTLVFGVGKDPTQERFYVLENRSPDIVCRMNFLEQVCRVYSAKIPKHNLAETRGEIDPPQSLVTRNCRGLVILFYERKVVALYKLRDGKRALWARSAFVNRPELLREQGADIGLGTVSVRHIGELDGSLLPDDAIAVNSGNKISLFSRRRKSFNQQYPYIVEALIRDLPDGTVIDGEIVALNESGRPEFNLLQNYRRDAGRIRYFVFDLLCYQNRDTTRISLVERRELLRSLKFQSPRIQLVDYLESSAASIVAAVKEQGLEGVIAKRRDSLYQPGRRTGAWVKYRINQGQEFVVGGYFPGPHGFDSIIMGYYSVRTCCMLRGLETGLCQLRAEACSKNCGP